jgi:hypothetical protein
MSDYIACRIAQLFIIVVFIMGIMAFIADFT